MALSRPHYLLLLGILICLHGLLILLRLVHFHEGRTGHAENAMDVHSNLDFHFGTGAVGLGSDFLN